jgi:hypothetical protein
MVGASSGAQINNLLTSGGLIGAVPPSQIGIASSILALVRNVAGAFGISVFATILTNATESSMVAIA